MMRRKDQFVLTLPGLRQQTISDEAGDLMARSVRIRLLWGYRWSSDNYRQISQK